MSPGEHEPSKQLPSAPQLNPSSEPLHPSPLLPELDEFFQDQRFSCVTQGSDQGTLLIIKAPRAEIRGLQGPLRINSRHELYEHPTAPVIRMVTTFYDQPDRPLAFETFLNVGDPQQRAEYEGLAQQEKLLMLFYDEQHQHRLTKQLGGIDREPIAE